MFSQRKSHGTSTRLAKCFMYFLFGVECTPQNSVSSRVRSEAVIRNPALTFEEAKQIAELSDWGYTSCCLLSRVDVPWDFLLDNIHQLSEISPRIILYTKPNCANTVTKWRQVVATLYDSALVIHYDSYFEQLTWKEYLPVHRLSSFMPCIKNKVWLALVN